ncbi:porin [Thalassotalea fusca]
MKLTNLMLVSALALTLAPAVNAEVNFSGYGSIVAGMGLNEGERFTADFFEVGQYEDKVTFKPESMIAIQMTADIDEKLRFTGQLSSKGSDDFEPEFSWYYLTYETDNDWTIMLGRRNIPMYYYSEFYDVGYAYPWMRPPSNLYWWQIVQFNGIHVSRNFSLGDYSNNITVYYGNEYSDDNKEMGFYAEQGFFGSDVVAVNEDWRHITGINWNISGDIFDVRFVYMQHLLDRDFRTDTGEIRQGLRTSQTFYGVGGSLDLNPFTILFEYNYVERHDDVEDTWPTFIVSAVYNIDDFQPYISYSKADQERISGDDFEQHYLISYGVRYNFSPSAAFKVQYDVFEDQGGPNGWDFHGDSETISLGVDFVF